ncbi:MAG: hypothetical protein OER85_05055 [Gammaproteobacteria bacterium]|nr:hypothetical protein [Gammaproteobacteria bacterium]
MSTVNSYLHEIDEMGRSGEVDEVDATDELDEYEEDEPEDRDFLETANVGETSVEINVEDLIAEIEAASPPRPRCADKPARKRLEELLEERRAARELGEDDQFDLMD